MIEGLRPVVSQSLTLRNRSGEIVMETWQKQVCPLMGVQGPCASNGRTHFRVSSVAGPHLCEAVMHTDLLLTHFVTFLTVTHSYIFWFPRYHVDVSMFIAVG